MMNSITLSGKINNQIINEIGEYLNGNVSSQEIDLTRFDDNTLLFLYRYGKMNPKEVKRIRHELNEEIKRRR